MDEIEVVAHSFVLGDVDDPEIYAAEPIWQWEHTEQGRWCRDHSTQQMTYTFNGDPYQYGYRVLIHARFRREDYTFFLLKWGTNASK
jgi:hypothetical protein